MIFYVPLNAWLNSCKYQAMTDFVVYRGDTNLENADKSEAGGDMIFHQFSRLRVVLSLDFISKHFEYDLFFIKIEMKSS